MAQTYGEFANLSAEGLILADELMMRRIPLPSVISEEALREALYAGEIQAER